jgi:glycerol-3-phosphate dehydrogenase
VKDDVYDIAIVGAGVVGCAIAREFSRYDCRTALIEARSDLGDGASKGNSAVLSTGADTPFGTLECRLVTRGHARYLSEARSLGLPILEIGSLTVAWNDDEVSRLEAIHAETIGAGFAAGRMIGPDEIYARAPHLAQGARAAIWDPDEAIVDPFSTPFAYALDAVANGVTYLHSAPVARTWRDGGVWHLETPQGVVRAGTVVNSAGLWADRVEAQAGFCDFKSKPRRGQFVVFDKSARPFLDVVVKPVPTPAYRGVLLTPTVFGNVLVGPTAEDIDDPDDWRTTREAIDALMAAAHRILPALAGHDVTATYCGIRPGTDRSEYRIIPRPEAGWLTVAGIRSTGLSGALGISEHVVSLAGQFGQPFARKAAAPVQVRVPDLSSVAPRAWETPHSPEQDHLEIVCHCEGTTLGRIREAFASPIPPRSLKALKRRTRATFGRCQGFYCGARVNALLDEALERQR